MFHFFAMNYFRREVRSEIFKYEGDYMAHFAVIILSSQIFGLLFWALGQFFGCFGYCNKNSEIVNV